MFTHDADQNLVSHWDLFFCRIRKTDTLLMEKTLAQAYRHYGRAHNITMTTTDLVDGDNSAHLVQHIVFCLDESGSMSGSKWAALQQAFESFCRQKLHDQGGDHFASVIQFASSERVTYEHMQIRNIGSLTMQSGGTEFGQPLRRALQLFQRHHSKAPVLVFM